MHRLRRDESLSDDSDMGPNVSDIQESLRQIETTQSENENLHAEIHILTAENANLRERLSTAESKEKSSSTLLEIRDAELHSLAEAYERKNQAVTNMQQQIETQRTELESYSTSALQKALGEANSYQNELQQEQSKFQKEREDFLRQQSDDAMRLEELTRQIAEYSKKTTNLEQKLQKKRDTIKSYHDAYDSFRSSNQVVSLPMLPAPAEAAQSPAPSQQMDQSLRVKPKDFPQYSAHASFSDFVISIKNYTARLLEQRYNDAKLAQDLFLSLSQSSLASKFLHELKKTHKNRPLESTKEALEVLERCDFEYRNLTPEERFRRMKAQPGEKVTPFLQRVEQAFDDALGNTMDEEKRALEIKRVFLEGYGFPLYLQDKLMPFSSLSQLAFAAVKLLDREEQKKVQNKQPLGQSNHFSNKRPNQQLSLPPPQVSSAPRPPPPPPMAPHASLALAPSVPVYTHQDGSTTFRPHPKDRIPAPPNSARAPTGADNDPRRNHCSFCRMMDHPQALCHYLPFCSICQIEGQHTNFKCPNQVVSGNTTA